MKKLLSIILLIASVNGIHAQEMLNYPLDTINGEEVYRYQVERSIGLYRIGVNFHVTPEEIIRWNPQLENRGLHYGETLHIPTGRPVVKESKAVIVETNVKETPIAPPVAQAGTESPKLMDAIQKVIQSAAKDSTVAITETPKDTTLSAQDSVAPYRTIEIALMLPFESQQTKRSGNAERMLEFYQGALIALNNLQSDSVHFRLRVYDTGRSERVVSQLFDSTELNQVQGILGVVYPIQIERVSSWCADHQVPLLLPFSAEEEIVQKPYVLQFNSMDKQQADSICSWISHREAHCAALEVRASDMSDYARVMRKQMQNHKITYSGMSLRDLMNDSVDYALDREKENIILLHSDKYQHVRILMPHLEKLQQDGYRIRIISQYSWAKENITIPQVYTSLFTADKSRESYDAQWATYFNTTHASDTPRYDLLGYDLTNALVGWIQGSKEEHGLQSEIRWEQIGDGGWQNGIVRIIEK